MSIWHDVRDLSVNAVCGRPIQRANTSTREKNGERKDMASAKRTKRTKGKTEEWTTKLNSVQHIADNTEWRSNTQLVNKELKRPQLAHSSFPFMFSRSHNVNDFVERVKIQEMWFIIIHFVPNYISRKIESNTQAHTGTNRRRRMKWIIWCESCAGAT